MDFLLFLIKYFFITVSFPRFAFAQFCHVFCLVEFQFVFTSLSDEGTKQPGGSYQLHQLHHVNNVLLIPPVHVLVTPDITKARPEEMVP